MDSHKRTYRYGAAWSRRHALLRRAGCLLTAAGLLPVLVLGPLGSGIILIHDHHEEDLHAHKVEPGAGGQAAPGTGHDHSTETDGDLEGARFVVTLPDLSRISTHVQASGLQAKPAPLSTVIASILPQNTAPSAVDFGAGNLPVAPLRVHDTMTNLLLSGHSLLL